MKRAWILASSMTALVVPAATLAKDLSTMTWWDWIVLWFIQLSGGIWW